MENVATKFITSIKCNVHCEKSILNIINSFPIHKRIAFVEQTGIQTNGFSGPYGDPKNPIKISMSPIRYVQ